MSTIMPEGDSIRRAVQYISDERKHTKKKPADLVHEACLKYDLSPAEAEYLNHLILEGTE